MEGNLGWIHCCCKQGARLGVPCIYTHKDVKWLSRMLNEPKKSKKGLRCYMSKMLKRLVYLAKLCAWRVSWKHHDLKEKLVYLAKLCAWEASWEHHDPKES